MVSVKENIIFALNEHKDDLNGLILSAVTVFAIASIRERRA
jgi:hypothetical protein